MNFVDSAIFNRYFALLFVPGNISMYLLGESFDLSKCDWVKPNIVKKNDFPVNFFFLVV